MRTRSLLLALLLCGLAPSTALAGHGLDKLDHPAPMLPSPGIPNPLFQSSPAGAWELVASIPTGNPHSDLDFFSRGGETYLSAGTLGTGPNQGGQTIVQLTQGGEVDPQLLAGAPTATCFSNPIETLGLQHDVEASPKGTVPLNTFNPYADARDAQVIVDASDGVGRCHDQGTLGLDDFGLGLISGPPGGLEIIDVTNPADPQTIGLTSHVGMAHTVNIDPKRPHIAYAVTSDQVFVEEDGTRSNDTGGLSLDGFEVVDMSSCMNFPDGTSLDAKRTACSPQVYRYRYPNAEMGRGHTTSGNIFGCHELEVYPNDRLTCAGGTALMTFDMTGAFDDRGTPDDYTDDRPRGTPLPCWRRESSSVGPFATGASVVDCVNGGNDGSQPLSVEGWLGIGSPSLDGVRHVGSVHHVGGTDQADLAAQPPNEDIVFDHEAELSTSGNLIIATDERGGGATPPGATCGGGGGAQANPLGNGGIHFYRADRLATTRPTTPEQAWQAYALTPDGGKAIYQAPIRTGAQAIICTSHVFQQIPGQNRIFMGWYSQGTQVLDFTENPDGTVAVEEVAFFLPAQANQWVSHIFKAQENPDGTFTYWGAAGDFRIGDGGRNTIDVYSVTLPAPPKPADGPGVLPQRVQGRPVRDPQTGETVIASVTAGAPQCVSADSIRSASVRRRGRRLSFAFSSTTPVQIDLFRQAVGRRITGERLVRRFGGVSGTVRWNGRDRRGRRLRDGYYLVRFLASTSTTGLADERRIALRLRRGRFTPLGSHARQDTCGLLRRWKLLRPVFGGSNRRPLVMSFRFASDARASIVVRNRRGRVVKRFAEQGFRGGVLHRKRISSRLARRLRRGRYRATITVLDGSRVIRSTLRATRV